ncbi:XdhC family protein [Hirschia litorea]|uniref:XdhC family protein n=1 Tax=Hirschia litorea TaxID=1199156 RepID=A0ABW2IHC2_9PROT
MLHLSQNPSPSSTEHPLDVITSALSFISKGSKTALVFVTDILGGAVRARGAVMAVSEDGEIAGYLSGGCIDADVKMQAISAIREAKFKTLRYGEGSPFYDLKLPCGGAIEVSICPNLSPAVLSSISQQLHKRKPISIKVSPQGQVLIDTPRFSDPPPIPEWKNGSFHVTYLPKLQLRIAGRGTDPIALARIANASGIPVSLWSPDTDTLEIANLENIPQSLHLKTSDTTPQHNDDIWTAFVLMFHDSQWETSLLKNALAGDAFYVGAVGSAKTHAKRCILLQEAGIEKDEIDRIHAPIGLVPSLRDASMLAISTLAEIIDAFQKRHTPS